MDKLKSLITSKNCILTAATLSILAIFFMFLGPITWLGTRPDVNPSMFAFCFGVAPADKRIPAYTAIFVFEILAILVSGAIIYFGCIKKTDTGLGVFSIINGIISLILLILAFCTLKFITKISGNVTAGNALGAGPIVFGIFHSLALLLNIGGFLLDLK